MLIDEIFQRVSVDWLLHRRNEGKPFKPFMFYFESGHKPSLLSLMLRKLLEINSPALE